MIEKLDSRFAHSVLRGGALGINSCQMKGCFDTIPRERDDLLTYHPAVDPPDPSGTGGAHAALQQSFPGRGV